MMLFSLVPLVLATAVVGLSAAADAGAARGNPVSASQGVAAGSGTSKTPCECAGGHCNCCTDFVMESLAGKRGCIKITSDPDHLAITMALSYDGHELIINRNLSAQNPPPLCVKLPEVPKAEMCVKLSDASFKERNLTACPDMEGKWDGKQVLQVPFNCISISAASAATPTATSTSAASATTGPAGAALQHLLVISFGYTLYCLAFMRS